MNVAMPELCSELFELSGWCDTFAWYEGNDLEWTDKAGYEGYIAENTIEYDWCHDIPAYDLGYLLRKLPPVIQDPYDRVFKHFQMWINGDGTVHAGYVEPYAHDDKVAYTQVSNSAEDTVMMLAIELFKQGILTPKENE